MAEEVMQLYLVAPAIYGVIVSLIEIFFVMQDEGGMHPMAHALHAVPVALILTYISMNAPWVGSFLATRLGWTFMVSPTIANIIIPIVVVLVATIKVKSAAAIVGGHGSVGEKLPHALIIGILIGVAPFVWGFLAPYLPAIINR